MKIELIFNIKKTHVTEAILRGLVRKVAGSLSKQLKGSPARQFKNAKKLTIVITSRAKIMTLNKIYRHKAKPTDVLSFAPTEPGSLGELVFCAPLIREQAMQHQISVHDEYIYLLIHGILHLLGFDHETNDKAARAMYRLQDKVFAEICEK